VWLAFFGMFGPKHLRVQVHYVHEGTVSQYCTVITCYKSNVLCAAVRTSAAPTAVTYVACTLASCQNQLVTLSVFHPSPALM
jgi:hypothetical protein